MNRYYKNMSQANSGVELDLIPMFAFWGEGCRVFAKNVATVMRMAGEEWSPSEIAAFLKSLPMDIRQMSSQEWQAGFCSQRLKKAYESVPDSEKEEFVRTVMDYFLYYFPDRDRCAKWMLIDAFMGFINGIADAEKEVNH